MIRAAIASRDFFPNPTHRNHCLYVPGTGGHGGSGQKFSFRRGNVGELERSGVLNESVDLVVAGKSENFFSHYAVEPISAMHLLLVLTPRTPRTWYFTVLIVGVFGIPTPIVVTPLIVRIRTRV